MSKRLTVQFFVKVFCLLLVTITSLLCSQLVIKKQSQDSNFNSIEKIAKLPNPNNENNIRDIAKAYNRLPLTFEANEGQVNKNVKFFSHGKNYDLFLTQKEAVFSLKSMDKTSKNVIKMKLSNMNSSTKIEAIDELQTKSNYLVGDNPSDWHTDIPHYAKVKYQEVYPNIDLIYYSNSEQLEYDLILYPGANPKDIKVQFDGVDKIKVEDNGDLLLKSGDNELRKYKPVIYQEDVNGTKKVINGSYVVNEQEEVSFYLDSYDQSKPLVIDPAFAYSTYLGGSLNDFGLDITVDKENNVYVTGLAGSTDFPITQGSLQPSSGGTAFVSKLNSSGNGVIYSTYIGGKNSGATSSSIVVDDAENVYITGNAGDGFPTTVGAFQKSCGGFLDAFVAVINPKGNSLLYSTYLGGSNQDSGSSIAVDLANNIYVTGFTNSTNFPTLNAFQPNNLGGMNEFGLLGQDAFVTKINQSGNVVYSTYLGGNGADEGRGIAVNSSGEACVVGATTSKNFPTANPLQSAFIGNLNVFVTKLTSTGSSLIYSTYLGSNIVAGNDIALDTTGNAYITGIGAGIPTTPGAFQSNQTSSGAYISKISPLGDKLIYSTYVAGRNGTNGSTSIAVDTNGNAYITGFTVANDFPVVNALQKSLAGGSDAFVAKLNSMGSALIYSTYLGGTGDENTFQKGGIAVDLSGNAYVTGSTTSTDFPVVNPFQALRKGSMDGFLSDVFVTKVSDSSSVGDFSLKIDPTETIVKPGASVNFTITAQGSNGFSQPIQLNSNVSPSNNNIFPTLSSTQITPNNTAILTINLTPTVPNSAFNVSITGTAGQIVRTVSAKLVVMSSDVDFSIVAEPKIQDVSVGASTSYVISAQRSTGFDQPIILDATVSPNDDNIKLNFSSNALIPNNSVTLTATTTSSVSPGTFSVSITGKFGDIIRTENVVLNVKNSPDFSLSFDPPSLMVERGKTVFSTININRINGFSGNVTVAPRGQGLKVKITPSSQSTTGTKAQFTFKVKKNAPTDLTEFLTFFGRDDSGRVRNATFKLVIIK